MAAGDYSIGSGHWPGLAKTTEECGEIIQAAAKIMAADGRDVHWDGTESLRTRLEDEIADARAAMSFLIWMIGLNGSRILDRTEDKYRLFKRWQNGNSGDH